MMSISTNIYSLKKLLGSRFCTNYPLAPLTSLKIGGFAEFLAFVKNIEELQKIMKIAKEEGIVTRILGKGTNLVIKEGLIKGIVIRLTGDFNQIARKDGNIEIGGGCPLSFLVKEAIKGNLSGTEGLVGIPGTLGGGIAMNAGTQIGSLGDIVETTEIFHIEEGKIITIKREDIGFSYRTTGIKENEIVLRACLRLRNGIEIKRRLAELLKKRLEKQPYKEKTAGSVFKNPRGEYAGKLIEDAGLKGIRCGMIEVSKKHANFFINLGKGTADDFMHLMDIVHDKVYKISGVDLEPEVKIWSK